MILLIIIIVIIIVIIITIKIIKLLIIITIIIIAIIIIVIIKCRSRCRTLTATNTELSVTYNGPKSANVTKKLHLRYRVGPTCASETAYSSLNVRNRGRPCRLNSLLGTLPRLISQEHQ